MKSGVSSHKAPVWAWEEKAMDGTKKNNFVPSKGFIYPTRKETEMLSSGQTFVVDESNGLQDSIAIGDDVRDLNKAGDSVIVENKKDAITSTEKNEPDTRMEKTIEHPMNKRYLTQDSNTKKRRKEKAKGRNKKNEKWENIPKFNVYYVPDT